MGKIVDKLVDWTILLGVMGYFLVGAPAAPELQNAINGNILSASWVGPGNEQVSKPNDCFGPSIPARPDLAPNPPYAQHSVTQFIHDCGEGNTAKAAIDFIAVGDATVLSPINGCVIRNGYDGIGNSVLSIENEQYIVTLLHGNYVAMPPACVRRGEPVGRDDSLGNSSGNHTHLSVFDKTTGYNAHPLALMK